VSSMPFDETNIGDPFYGDFPDLPDEGPWAELAATVQQQLRAVQQLRLEPEARHAFLELLMRRRESAGRVRDRVVTAFDFLPVEVGFDLLLVPGELLLARPTPGWDPDPDARGLLDDLGLDISEVDCDELRSRVLRLVPAEPMSPQQLADAAAVLRGNGLDASVSTITACGPIAKTYPSPPPAGPGPLFAASGGAAAAESESGSGSGAEARLEPGGYGGPGEPAVVIAIDTGRTRDLRADGWLNNVPRERDNIDLLHEFPLPDGDGFLGSAAGHGTFVLGCIRQVAPGADVRVYRAVDSDGIASEVRVACEMIRAVKQGGAQIVNLSVSCQTPDNVPPVALRAALEVIREWEHETGREVLIVAAAGNFGDTLPTWPAAFPGVVSVAALTPGLAGAGWSTSGPGITCSAVGEGIYSTFVTGRESPQLDPAATVFGPDAWAVWSGTSFATPQIAGAVARLYQENGYPLRQALDVLLAAGEPLEGYGQALKILPGL
jgi:Subtilase family